MTTFYSSATPKYLNKKTTVDGIEFDSKREAARYGELKSLLAAGVIANLELQPSYELVPAFRRNGKAVRAIHYIADFRYVEGGKVIVEDVKGFAPPVFLLKQKLFWHRYPDIELRVIK